MKSTDVVLFYISRKLRKVKGYSDCIRIIPKSAQGAYIEIVKIMRSRGLSFDNVHIWNDVCKNTEPNLRAAIFQHGWEDFTFVRPD